LLSYLAVIGTGQANVPPARANAPAIDEVQAAPSQNRRSARAGLVHRARQAAPGINEEIHAEASSDHEIAQPAATAFAPKLSDGGVPSTPAAAPPSPSGSEAADPVQLGRELFRSHGCFACHGKSAQGTSLAPSLVGVSQRYPGDRLSELLHHPSSKMQEGGMPAITLAGPQFDELLAFLASLKPSAEAMPANGSQSPDVGVHSSQLSASPVSSTGAAKRN